MSTEFDPLNLEGNFAQLLTNFDEFKRTLQAKFKLIQIIKCPEKSFLHLFK
jgi:hypothetical protein